MDRLQKLREERAAREKKRIEMLRELNLKKYSKSNQSESALPPRNAANNIKPQSAPTKNVTDKLQPHKNVKNNFHVNGNTKKAVTAPPKKMDYTNIKPKVVTHTCKTTEVTMNRPPSDDTKTNRAIPSTSAGVSRNIQSTASRPSISCVSKTNQAATKTNTFKNPEIPPAKQFTTKVLKEIPNPGLRLTFEPKIRRSLAMPIAQEKPKPLTRKSMMPTLSESKSESVFDRLYKPKVTQKKVTDKIEKLQTDPSYLNKLVKGTDLILGDINRKIFEAPAPRRSISAIHLKKISKNEAQNCIHKWASIGHQINQLDVNEDSQIKEDKIIPAIKSERKVKFMTPVSNNFNTPRPEELQARLKLWLQKRGKALDSYHHLQCFGIHHLKSELSTPVPKVYDEENKENIALESDSDDGSYIENMNEKDHSVDTKMDLNNWRRASFDSESVGFNDSNRLNETTLTSADSVINHTDELLIGALNDLTNLLKEGFSWQTAARWLRVVRARCPAAADAAAYWECRAALEEARGDLPASLTCWEHALAQGTQHSVVEANLDQLLDKFMQLRISPSSGLRREPNPRLVDVKNVFKSTIIRFAVHQAKMRGQSSSPITTVTPVRRSGRLSRHTPQHAARHTPQHAARHTLCDTLRHAATVAPAHRFTPNRNLPQTP